MLGRTSHIMERNCFIGGPGKSEVIAAAGAQICSDFGTLCSGAELGLKAREQALLVGRTQCLHPRAQNPRGQTRTCHASERHATRLRKTIEQATSTDRPGECY